MNEVGQIKEVRETNSNFMKMLPKMKPLAKLWSTLIILTASKYLFFDFKLVSEIDKQENRNLKSTRSFICDASSICALLIFLY